MYSNLQSSLHLASNSIGQTRGLMPVASLLKAKQGSSTRTERPKDESGSRPKSLDDFSRCLGLFLLGLLVNLL